MTYFLVDFYDIFHFKHFPSLLPLFLFLLLFASCLPLSHDFYSFITFPFISYGDLLLTWFYRFFLLFRTQLERSLKGPESSFGCHPIDGLWQHQKPSVLDYSFFFPSFFFFLFFLCFFYPIPDFSLSRNILCACVCVCMYSTFTLFVLS